jgi:hypothetical protein
MGALGPAGPAGVRGHVLAVACELRQTDLLVGAGGGDQHLNEAEDGREQKIFQVG